VNKEYNITEEDRTLMGQYGITSASKMMYFYKEYRYENLSDALHYAKNVTERTQNNAQSTPTET
jgi:hypothetical protein